MLEAIGSENTIQSWGGVESNPVDRLSHKISQFVLELLPQMLATDDMGKERIARAFSYLALKIEDIQYLENFAIAYQHKNLESMKTLLSEIKQRPESFVMNQALEGFLESAIDDNEDAIVDMIWAEMGDFLDIEDAFYMLESAVKNNNSARAMWLIENFKIDDNCFLEEVIDMAIAREMVLVVETLTSKFEKNLDLDCLKNKGREFFAGEKYLWA